MRITQFQRTRLLTTVIAASAILLACAGCAPASGPGPENGGTASSSSNSDATDTGSSSGSDDSADSSNDNTEIGGSRDAAGTPFCTDLVSAPTASDDDSDAGQLKQVVDFWQKLADESPSGIKPKVSAIADGYRRIQAGDTSAASDQSWVDNVTAVSDYFVAHC